MVQKILGSKEMMINHQFYIRIQLNNVYTNNFLFFYIKYLQYNIMSLYGIIIMILSLEFVCVYCNFFIPFSIFFWFDDNIF
mmetsp:Transcript_36809/g.45479  ORF Transcript_36809/g.45479 Transcript_36809/m.45479 type:complete len:81 (+) Transcript_36809:818-1060(+)